jgi:hypothetical protein
MHAPAACVAGMVVQAVGAAVVAGVGAVGAAVGGGH